MRITLVINSLSAGGAERILAMLANRWAAEGHLITVITFRGTAAFYELESSINSTLCSSKVSETDGALQKLLAAIFFLPRLRRTILASAPERVISFMDQANILSAVSLLWHDVPLVVSERIYPAHSSLMEITKNRFLKSLVRVFRNIVYLRARSIVVLTRDAQAYFPRWLQSRIRIIPNAVLPPPDEAADYTLPTCSIVGMGRLSAQKRFDLLIEAFRAIAPDYPQWSLTIFGEGELRHVLQDQIESAGLHDRISLPGLTRTPQAVLRQAQIFILSSDYEGFPGALLQAMSAGVAVIATVCRSGPSEIIESGRNGLLVPVSDATALQIALRDLIGDESKRERLGLTAMEIGQRYKPQTFFAAWSALLV